MIGTSVLLALAVLTDREYLDRAQRWFLLEGNRGMITGILVVLAFIGMILIGASPLVALAEEQFTTTIFQVIASGLLSLIPIVISVNQLTISQLSATPGDLQQQIKDIHDFRTDVEDLLPKKSVASTDPSRFFLAVNDLLAKRATMLRNRVEDTENQPLAEQIDDYAGTIIVDTQERDSRIQETNMQLIQILLPAMLYDDYTKQYNTARKIQRKTDSISKRTSGLLDEVRELFIIMNVTRQYFRGLYIQQELAKLSKLIAYTGSLAIIISTFSLLIFIGEQPLPLRPLLGHIVVSAVFALALTPVAVLVAFIMRIATIVKRTIAPGTFAPPDEEPDYDH